MIRALGRRVPATGPEPRAQWSHQYFSQARWALRAAVTALSGGGRARLWLPAYICTEAVAPFRKGPFQLLFYPLTDDLAPDWDWLDRARPQSGDVLVLVHYFGFAGPAQVARSFCDQRGLALIEDAAHVLGPGDGFCGAGQAVVYSPRKQLPLPDGGVLALDQGWTSAQPSALEPGSGLGLLVWAAKRLVQHYAWAGPGRRSVLTPRESSRPMAMSGLARRLWNIHSPRLDRVIEARQRNYAQLALALTGLDGIAPLFATSRAPAVPYLCPLVVDRDRDRVQKALRRRGVPAGTWPDLPPEVVKDPVGQSAVRLQGQLITLPVHQDLTNEQIGFMTSRLLKLFSRLR